ncbi:MAG TPA: hypothetical protein VFI34_01520 [Candidatus Limnocylindrales bacterium]|nr:hypothetical protein [Candidatus Limnocylindrales bacterium]
MPQPIDIGPPSPTPIATPAPAIPEDLKLTGTAERDGARLSIRLARNPMPAGEATGLTVTITNTADDLLLYYPCGEIVPVDGTLSDAWRMGRDLRIPVRDWKSYLLDNDGFEPGAPPQILLLAKGHDGSSSGCGDVGLTATLDPGDSVRQRLSWNGLRFRDLGPPPTSKVDLTATLAFDRGAVLDEHPPEDRHIIEAHLDAWIEGPADPVLDPAEAVDVALTDARLTNLLATRELNNGNDGLLRYVAAAHRYWVGIVESGSLPIAHAHYLEIEAETGAILGFVERDWDYQVDGYP